MFDRFHGRLGALAFALLIGVPASAQTIEADTTGEENLTDPRYYGVDFLAGGQGGNFLASVSFDISADIDGFFDLDGTTNFGGALEPVVDPGSLVGLTAGDISWSFTGNQPNVITANFAAGSFGVGDSFRFAVETDLFVSDPCPGGNFNLGGALFTAVLEGGASASATFTFVNKEVAVATADVTSCAMSLTLPSRTIPAGGALEVQMGLLHNAPWSAETNVSAAVTGPTGKVIVDWTSPEYTIASGGTLNLNQRFRIPASTPPGVYTVGVGIGEMRQGFAIRSMEFVVVPSKRAEATGAQTTAPQK